MLQWPVKVCWSVRRISIAGGGLQERDPNAAFEAPGPSKYFADAAIQAAKNWTFAPPNSNGEKVPSEWLLRFEFAPAGTETFSAELNP